MARRSAISVMLALAAWEGGARAGESLVVQRGRGATDCPTAFALAAMVQKLTPKAPHAGDGEERIEVTFTRERGGFRADVRMVGARTGTRTLSHPSATCAPIAEATSFAIAILVDPDFVSEEEAQPSVPPSPPISASTAERSGQVAPPIPSPPPSRDMRGFVGAGLAVGVVRRATPLLAIEGTYSFGRFSLHVGGATILPQRIELPPAAVETWLLAGSSGGCFLPFRVPSLQLGACVSLHVGLVGGSGSGVRNATSILRPWFAADAHAVAWGHLAGALGWSARLGALLPFQREAFAISGAGIAYEPLPVAFFAVLGPSLTFP